MDAPPSMRMVPVLIASVMTAPYAEGSLHHGPFTLGYTQFTLRVSVRDYIGIKRNRCVYQGGEGHYNWRHANQEEQQHQVAGRREYRHDGIEQQRHPYKARHPKVLLGPRRLPD